MRGPAWCYVAGVWRCSERRCYSDGFNRCAAMGAAKVLGLVSDEQLAAVSYFAY